MLDIPCGALVWQQALFASLRAANHPLRYHGADIVPFLVESHQRKRRDLTSPLQGMEANFSVVDFSDRQAALPAGFDLLLSRDGLQHNTLQQIARGLYTFSRAAAKWLLIGLLTLLLFPWTTPSSASWLPCAPPGPMIPSALCSQPGPASSGSYPDSQNTPMARAGSSRVELDLSAPPFCLPPRRVYLETSLLHTGCGRNRTGGARGKPCDHAKHLYLYGGADWRSPIVLKSGPVPSSPLTPAVIIGNRSISEPWRRVRGARRPAGRRAPLCTPSRCMCSCLRRTAHTRSATEGISTHRRAPKAIASTTRCRDKSPEAGRNVARRRTARLSI